MPIESIKKLIQSIKETAAEGNKNLYANTQSLDILETLSQIVKTYEEGERNKNHWQGIIAELETDSALVRSRFSNLNELRGNISDSINQVRPFLNDFKQAFESGVFNVKEILSIFSQFNKMGEGMIQEKITEIRVSFPGLMSEKDSSMVKAEHRLSVEVALFPEKGPKSEQDFERMDLIKADLEFMDNTLSYYLQHYSKSTGLIQDHAQNTLRSHQALIDFCQEVLNSFRF